MLEVDERVARRRVRERSEEHTSELQSQSNLVCRLLLEKKKNNESMSINAHHARNPILVLRTPRARPYITIDVPHRPNTHLLSPLHVLSSAHLSRPCHYR